MGAISIGTTGLTASSKQMDVIGNNLANSNTLGFKASSTQFASILSDSGTLAVGQGVGVSAITTQFSQGSFENTGNATDLAIDGEGFFMVKDNEGAVYCTRAGAFHVNAAGYLVDTNNYQVQGYTASTTDVDAVEEETAISLQNVQSAPKASTEISIGANLDESANYGDKFNVSQSVFDTKGQMHNLSIIFQKTEGQGMWGFDAKIDSTKISDTALQFACGITFDSNGLLSGLYKGEIENVEGTGTIVGTVISRPGQLYKSTPVEAAADDTAIPPTPATSLEEIVLTKGSVTGSWTTTEDEDGDYLNILAWQEASGDNEYLKVDLDGKGGADIVFDLGATEDNEWAEDDTITFGVKQSPIELKNFVLTFGDLDNGATIGVPEGTDKNKITWDITGDTANIVTGYSSTSVIKAIRDNGYASGVLKGLNIGRDGVISGFFTNGQTSNLSQLVLADFPNKDGLIKIGSYFAETDASGGALKNRPGSASLGEIRSNSLELSNTDVAKEFINMITAQRAYQASSRIITTADQMLTELMNIKR